MIKGGSLREGEKYDIMSCDGEVDVAKAMQESPTHVTATHASAARRLCQRTNHRIQPLGATAFCPPPHCNR